MEKENAPQDLEGEDRKEEQHSMRRNIRENCRLLLLEEADRRDTTLTRRDVQDWLTAMEEDNLSGPDLRSEKDKTKAVLALSGEHLRKFIADAREAAAEGLRMITEAEEKKWILPASAKEWRARVKDEGHSWLEKKEFIIKTLPQWYTNWQQIAKDYTTVKNLEKELGIGKEEAKKISTLADLHDPKFMSGALEYPERRKRVDLAKDFLEAYKKNGGKEKMNDLPKLLARAAAILQPAIANKAVDAGKRKWLERKLVSFDNPQERKTYVETTLPEYVKAWIKLRTEYNSVEDKMRKNVPQGFNRLKPEKFLLLSYPQRRSYVEQAKQRLNLTEAPSPREMENIKLGIRHALDTKEWDEAEHLLKQARKLFGQGKGIERDRFELDSLERYLKEFRTKEHEEQRPMKSARETLEQMRMAYDQIPTPLQPLYLSAMNDPDKLGAIASCTYNRIWCREHGYLTDDREKELEREATIETQNLAREGKHRKKGLDNVKLGVVTDKQHDPAVRRYDEGEWAPTIIHMPPGTYQHFDTILETRKNNHAFRYWTTLIPTDVTYEQQQHLVKNVNWVIKRGAKKLKEQGMMFTLTGNPPSLN